MNEATLLKILFYDLQFIIVWIFAISCFILTFWEEVIPTDIGYSITAILAICSIFRAFQIRGYYSDDVFVEGKVIEGKETKAFGFSTDGIDVKIKFEYKGKEYIKKRSIGGDKRLRRVGTKVEVLINTKNAEKSIILIR